MYSTTGAEATPTASRSKKQPGQQTLKEFLSANEFVVPDRTHPVYATAEAFGSYLTKACDSCMRRTGVQILRKPVHW